MDFKVIFSQLCITVTFEEELKKLTVVLGNQNNIDYNKSTSKKSFSLL